MKWSAPARWDGQRSRGELSPRYHGLVSTKLVIFVGFGTKFFSFVLFAITPRCGQRNRGEILREDFLHFGGDSLRSLGSRVVSICARTASSCGIGVGLAVIGAPGAAEDPVDRIGRRDPAAVNQVVVALVASLAVRHAGLVVRLRLDADRFQLRDHDLLRQVRRRLGRPGQRRSRTTSRHPSRGLRRLPSSYPASSSSLRAASNVEGVSPERVRVVEAEHRHDR